MMDYRSIALIVVMSCLPGYVLAAPTPPVMPKITETPLPAAVELPAPEEQAIDVPVTPLTAAEAAAIALRHQPGLKVAAANVTAAQGQLAQAQAGLRPSVTGTGTYTETAVTSEGGGAPVPVQLGINARQLLFDFERTRTQVRQARAQRAASDATLSRAQSDLVYQVKQAFYQYTQNARLVEINRANLRNQQQHLAQAQARVQAGLGLPVDVVRAQTAVTNAIFNLNVAQNAASIARTNLAFSMGIDPRTPLSTADSEEAPVVADNVNVLVTTALQQRPEMRQWLATIEAQRLGVAIAKTGKAPALAGTLTLNDRGSGFPPSDLSVNYGLALQWNLYDAGLTSGRRQTAEANLQAAQAQLQALQLSVVSEVSQAYLILKTAEQRAITAGAEVANAQEAVNLTQGRYNAGLGTFIDVLDAQTALFTAQTNVINAASSINLARASLAHAVGADPQYVQLKSRSGDKVSTK